MEQGLSWEANQFSASQEIPCIFWKTDKYSTGKYDNINEVVVEIVRCNYGCWHNLPLIHQWCTYYTLYSIQFGAVSICCADGDGEMHNGGGGDAITKSTSSYCMPISKGSVDMLVHSFLLHKEYEVLAWNLSTAKILNHSTGIHKWLTKSSCNFHNWSSKIIRIFHV